MKRSARGCSFLAIGLLLLALPLAGCDRDCAAADRCPRDGSGGAATTGGGPVCPDDPAEGEIGPSCGVWVSGSLGDDDNDGTQGYPVRTLARGIDLAKMADSGARRVYACEGTYSEAVELPSGISLLGGFECPTADGWRYAGFEKRAVIQALPQPVALVLTKGDDVSFIADVKVVASDAIEPGGSSVAALALFGSKARFLRAELIAGNGADGADGANGSPDGAPALPGLDGNHGADACSSNVGLGGLGVVTLCDDGTQSISGQGGNGNLLAANAGGDGLPAPQPNPEGYGKGGKGQDAAKGTLCTPGYGGAHGVDGFHGFGSFGRGRLTEDGYLGVPGDDGKPGLPGQGGGGGGGSLGVLCPGPLFGGSGGGSGGSGGCGGKAGTGGQAGGSSIGIAVLSDAITAGDLIITTGNGGNGGNGGVGQVGALGGLPGYGGSSPNGAKGCGGGIGGSGGNGGNGGGGHGGPSFAIAIANAGVKFVWADPTYTTGKYGLGGLGGDQGAAAGLGENGSAGQVGDFDP